MNKNKTQSQHISLAVLTDNNSRASLLNGTTHRNNTRPSSSSSSSQSKLQDKIYEEHTEALYEQQNNEEVNVLNIKVEQLMNMTRDINTQLKSDNTTLTSIDEDFSHTNTSLSGTMSRLEHMINTGGSKHMCYLIFFVFFVFVFIYYVMTRS